MQIFLVELSKEQRNGRLYNDSMNVIHLARNIDFHIKKKHIQLKHNFTCTLVEGEHISLEKIYTAQNAINMLTKIVT